MNTEEYSKNEIIDNESLPSAKRKKTTRREKKKLMSETDIKIKKAKRTKAGIAAFVLLLAVGVTGNWYYENSNIASTIEPLISSHSSKVLGEAEYVGATTQAPKENEYFSSARVDRQTARDSSIEKLNEIINNPDQGDEAKANATEKLTQISSFITIENKIETLVTAKGARNCLAVINEDGTRVDVIVDVDELTDAIILQIKEIAMEQLGVGFENVSIIQSK